MFKQIQLINRYLKLYAMVFCIFFITVPLISFSYNLHHKMTTIMIIINNNTLLKSQTIEITHFTSIGTAPKYVSVYQPLDNMFQQAKNDNWTHEKVIQYNNSSDLGTAHSTGGVPCSEYWWAYGETCSYQLQVVNILWVLKDYINFSQITWTYHEFLQRI